LYLPLEFCPPDRKPPDLVYTPFFDSEEIRRLLPNSVFQEYLLVL
jgi:hypothetical protein